MVRPLTEANRIIGDWAHYLILSHSQQVRPGFADKILHKTAELLLHMINFKEKETNFIKA